MEYAVNVADLTKDAILAKFLIAPVVKDKVILAEAGKIDGDAVILECCEERAQAIIAVIRHKYHRNLLRCYTSKNSKTWRKV